MPLLVPGLGPDVANAPRVRLALIAYTAASAAVILDQATKRIAEQSLVLGRNVPWLGQRIGWELTLNDGGAFGVDAPSWIFLVVTAVVTVIVLRNLPHVTTTVSAWAYGLLLAGAWGNALDRLFRPPAFLRGHVIDFIAWGSYPRFNIADVSITAGFVLLVLELLREGRSEHGSRSSLASSA